MNLKQVKEEISQGEGLNTEFKEAWNGLPENLFETICSFLNTDGGIILLGVNDKGAITGVMPESVERLKTELANLSNNPQKLEPPYLMFSHSFNISGKTVIAFQVPVSRQFHRTKGRFFIRSIDGDYKVQGTHQIAGLVNRKLGIFTEQRPQKFFTMDDLRPTLFETAREMMFARNSNHPWGSLSNESLLKVGGFYATDENTGKTWLTLAAVLLFGTDIAIHRALPSFTFDCLLLKDNIDRYDDRVMIHTNLFDAYDQMMDFVEKHLNDPFFLENNQNVSLRDKIFREAVSNIICHREYMHPTPARLMIYRDRVVLDNPCTRHHFGEITLDNLKPFPKNPTISKFMTQIGRSEELGSGVRNLNKYLPFYSHGAKPVFMEQIDCFELTIPLVAKSKAQVTPEVTPHVTPEVVSMLRILEGEMSRVEIQEILLLKDEKHFREHYQQQALKLGLIEMTIPDKPRSRFQKYRITDKGMQFIKTLRENNGNS